MEEIVFKKWNGIDMFEQKNIKSFVIERDGDSHHFIYNIL